MPKKTKPKAPGISINITTEQFKEGVRRQYGQAVTGLTNSEELSKVCKEWGVNPDELAKEIQSDIDDLENLK